MKIRMLVNGDAQETYPLERGKQILEALQPSNLILDEARQLAKIEDLKEDSSVIVIPRVLGG